MRPKDLGSPWKKGCFLESHGVNPKNIVLQWMGAGKTDEQSSYFYS